MLNVLITNFHPGDGGGHTTYIMNLAKQTDALGSVQVASPSKSKLASLCREAGIPHFPVDFPGKLREAKAIIKNVQLLRTLLKTQPFDIIHVNGSPDHRLVIYALIGLGRPRPRIIVTKHNCFPLKTSFLGTLRYRKFSTAIISVCKKVSDELQARLLGSSVPVHTIGNGIDTVHFSRRSSPLSRKEWRRQLNLPENSTIFVSCAGTGFHKGWQHLAKVLADRTDIVVVVLGSPPPERRLEETFNGAPPKNLIFPGAQRDVRPFLWASDVGFVLSTAIETISFACREMMAAGIPVLVNNFGCLPENIDNGSGWVTDSLNHSALAQALTIVLSSDLKAMGLNAENRAISMFTVEEFRLKTFNVYKNVTNVGNDVPG